MSELAVLLEWTLAGLEEVLAHLGLVLLFQGVKLALVAVKIVVVGLLGQMSHHLAWGIVEVLLWLAVGSELASILTLGLWMSIGELGT